MPIFVAFWLLGLLCLSPFAAAHWRAWNSETTGPGGLTSGADWNEASSLNRVWDDVSISANAFTADGDGKYRITACATALQTINGTADGDIVVLSIDGAGCTSLTIEDNTGNIQLPNNRTITLTSAEQHLLLIHKGSVLAPGTLVTDPQVQLKLAYCVEGTAQKGFEDSPLLTEPAVACINGTNKSYGVADFDAAADEGVQFSFLLPPGLISMAFDLYWHAAATSGAVNWCLQTACVAVGETHDTPFNTAQCVSDTAAGTTNQRNVASISSVTLTGCAAGEQFTAQILRDGNGSGGTDSMTGDAQGVEAVFTILRAQ